MTDASRWTIEKAMEWYESLPWLIGCNFIPSNAINQLDMWQEERFDPETINRELGWAAGIGFNVVRVYLHDLAFEQNPEAFLDRVEHFLDLADSHAIKTVFVFFDDCWLTNPEPGKQPQPWPGVHNSGWLESPGKPQLERYEKDADLRGCLERYVKATLSRFQNDDRVVMWDLYNEPGGIGYTRGKEPGDFERIEIGELCLPLLRDVYEWAREINPSQPLTSCWNRGDLETEAALEWADIVTFHCYRNPQALEDLIKKLRESVSERPMICTEYLARSHGNRFDNCLPIFRKHGIGAINWGLVSGKTNTIYEWKSWSEPGTPEPEVWHHDVFRNDGTPYDPAEIKLIKSRKF